MQAAGADEARLIVVTIKDRDKSVALCRMIQRHFPKAKLYVRAYDRIHAFELMDLGVDGFERETFRSALALSAKVLVGLGYSAHNAQRIAKSFEWHDQELLEHARKLRDDDDRLCLLRQRVPRDPARGDAGRTARTGRHRGRQLARRIGRH